MLRVSELRAFTYLDPYLKIHIADSNTDEWPQSSRYKAMPNYIDRAIPLEMALKTHYLSVKLINDSKDTAHYFISCSPQEDTQLRTQATRKSIQYLQIVNYPVGNDYLPLYSLTIVPEDTLEIQTRLTLSRQPLNFVYNFIIPINQTDQFYLYWQGIKSSSISNLIFIGMLLMMGAYIFSKYLQIRAREYLFYSLYIFFLFAFAIIKELQLNYSPVFLTNELVYSFCYRAMQVASYCMYFLFFQYFLSTKKFIPFFHRQLTILLWLLVCYLAADFLMTVADRGRWLVFQYQLWDVIRIGLMGYTCFAVIHLYRQREKLPNPKLSLYIVAGAFGLMLFSGLSMILSLDHGIGISSLPAPFSLPFFYYQFGVALELLTFSSGLGYKNRLDEVEKIKTHEALKRESERFEFEQYKAATEAREVERSRIAKDLHDGVGGLLSGVLFLLSGLREKLALKVEESISFDRALNQLGNSIYDLRKVAHDLLPDSLVRHGLVAALKDYSQSINDLGVIQVNCQVVGNERRLSAEREGILYRIVQELLTNTMRHAAATEVLVQIVYHGQSLALTVEDNGVGFDVKGNFKKGIGLANIYFRVSELRAKMDIKSSDTKGTSVYIEIPFFKK